MVRIIFGKTDIERRICASVCFKVSVAFGGKFIEVLRGENIKGTIIVKMLIKSFHVIYFLIPRHLKHLCQIVISHQNLFITDYHVVTLPVLIGTSKYSILCQNSTIRDMHYTTPEISEGPPIFFQMVRSCLSIILHFESSPYLILSRINF